MRSPLDIHMNMEGRSMSREPMMEEETELCSLGSSARPSESRVCCVFGVRLHALSRLASLFGGGKKKRREKG